MTEDWGKVLEGKKEWLMVPEVAKSEGSAAPPAKATKWEDIKSSGTVSETSEKKKAAVGNNSK